MVVALFLTGMAASQTQPQTPEAKICPAALSVHPVDIRQGELPLQQQARFEIRVCNLGDAQYVQRVQLLGFSRKAAQPTLIVDTHSQRVELLIHTGTVLVIQVTGGDSSPVYVAQFQNGKPVLISQEDGVGGVSYSEEHPDKGDYAVITVPQKTFPGPDGEFPKVPPHRFRLKIHEE
jgi:hypothetical protein